MTISAIVVVTFLVKVIILAASLPTLAILFLWPVNERPISKLQWVFFVVAAFLLFDVLFFHFIHWIL